MTSIPARRGTLGPTLDSLRAQTIKPDSIQLHAVDAALDFDFSGWPELELHHLERDPGPVAKLSALNDRTLDDDDLVVTVDDDQIYEPRWLEMLVAGAKAHPDCAVGMAGWNANNFIEAKRRGDPEGGFYNWAHAPGFCDVLEGFAGVAYRKRFFWIDSFWNRASVLNPMPIFDRVDDVWIAYYLKNRGVKRALVHTKMCHERPGALSGLHNHPEFVSWNRRAAMFAFDPNP